MQCLQAISPRSMLNKRPLGFTNMIKWHICFGRWLFLLET